MNRVLRGATLEADSFRNRIVAFRTVRETMARLTAVETRRIAGKSTIPMIFEWFSLENLNFPAKFGIFLLKIVIFNQFWLGKRAFSHNLLILPSDTSRLSRLPSFHQNHSIGSGYLARSTPITHFLLKIPKLPSFQMISHLNIFQMCIYTQNSVQFLAETLKMCGFQCFSCFFLL